MKRTSLSFLFAIALFLVALGSAQLPEDLERRTQALDFEGIDSLRVVSTLEVEIEISGDKPELTYMPSDKGQATVHREGNTLVVTANYHENVRYDVLQLTVPATVHSLQTGDARISAKQPVDSITVISGESVIWSGAARELHIGAQFRDDDCNFRHCQSEVTIEAGPIQDLTVSLKQGNVELQDTSVGSTTLRLGPKATFSLMRVRDVGNLTIEPYREPELPDAPPTKISP